MLSTATTLQVGIRKRASVGSSLKQSAERTSRSMRVGLLLNIRSLSLQWAAPSKTICKTRSRQRKLPKADIHLSKATFNLTWQPATQTKSPSQVSPITSVMTSMSQRFKQRKTLKIQSQSNLSIFSPSLKRRVETLTRTASIETKSTLTE